VRSARPLLGSAINLHTGLSRWIPICSFAVLSSAADRDNRHHRRGAGLLLERPNRRNAQHAILDGTSPSVPLPWLRPTTLHADTDHSVVVGTSAAMGVESGHSAQRDGAPASAAILSRSSP
jgi:hypothetical protein